MMMMLNVGESNIISQIVFTRDARKLSKQIFNYMRSSSYRIFFSSFSYCDCGVLKIVLKNYSRLPNTHIHLYKYNIPVSQHKTQEAEKWMKNIRARFYKQ